MSSAGTGEPLFREVSGGPIWLRMAGVLVLVAAVLLVVDATVIDPASFQGGGAIAAVVGAVVLLAVGILLLVVRIVVEVTVAEVALALAPLFTVRFARSEVAGAKAVDMIAREFGGVGYRVLPGNRRGLLLSSGTGVVVTRQPGPGAAGPAAETVYTV
ncbi:hypothetical protein [Subtercola vilae]|uniref:PH domain-containing protein n=2 Tax=Subtercola TaxID=120212 RepID=A0A4T2C631_9MICO|nr:hypothetical protein [Subtercola vilae]TIH38711.1 hypothetical protein D4765_06360 [Subtercola vilae]